MGKEFTRFRKAGSWLQKLSFSIVRYVLKYQADAWNNSFKCVRGQPQIKAKRGDDSFTIPERAKIRSGRIRIPNVDGLIIWENNPYPDGTPIKATVKQVGKKWYCTVTYDVDLPEPVDDGLAIGIDKNIGQVAASTGDLVSLPDTVKLEKRQKYYQRMVALRQKGSKRRKRALQHLE